MNTRKISVDIAKTIAIICVILIHSMKILGTNINDNNFLFNIILADLPRIAVPLFLMCSGVLLLDKDKHISIHKLYTRYIPRILIALAFFSILYKAFHLVLAKTFSANDIKIVILDLLVFKDEFHLYYLHIILLVYILLPVTKIFINNASKKEIEYLLVVFFIFGIIYPTANYLVPNFNLTGIPKQWGLNMTYTSIGYTILGYYLDQYGLSTKKSLSAVIIGLSFSILGTYMLSRHNDKLILSLFEGMSFGICMYSLGMFALISKISSIKSKNISNLFYAISKASFSIYLVHVFYLILINTYWPSCNQWIKALIIFILSYLSYKIFEKIPFFKKWII